MEKVWTERSICTDDQLVRIMPNKEQDCVVVQIHEINEKKSKCRLFLSYDEAKVLAQQLCGFVDDKLCKTD